MTPARRANVGRLAALAAAAGLGSAAAPLAAQGARAHQPTSYDITLVTSDTGGHIVGEVQTAWRLGAATPVELELDSVLRVVRVLVDGKPNTRISRTMYARPGSEVVVPHEKTAGDTLTTRVRYHGTPHDGLRVGPDRTGARALAGETAAGRGRFWLPMPPSEAGSEPGRATVTWSVQAGKGARAVANGVLVKVDTLAYDHTAWHYRLDTPVPLDAFAVAAGHYAVTALPHGSACPGGCVPVTLWTAPEDSAAATAGAFRRAGEIVEYLRGVLGDFPYPGLAHVASSFRPAGRPGASVVLWDETLVHAGRISEDEIVRATAAQWLGNAVTESGPASERPSPALAAYLATRWSEAHPGAAPSRPAAPPPGMEAIRRLDRMIGDSAFVRGLRRYVDAHRNATAPPGALERAMSEAAGRKVAWSFASTER